MNSHLNLKGSRPKHPPRHIAMSPESYASQFENARNVRIKNSTLTTSTNNFFDTSGTRGREILLKEIAKGAGVDCLDSFDRPGCQDQTREAVLDAITSWADARPDREGAVFWLHGPAGAGKSAIVQTIGKRFQDNKKLAASFFFSESVNGRNCADRFFATIAHQLAFSIPDLGNSIMETVERNPGIFSSSLETQMKTLIIDPLRTLITNIHHKAYIITIDGLDECRCGNFQRGVQFQQEILRVVWDALVRYNLPLYFLIASRPERHLQEMFQLTLISEIYTPLTLNRDFKPDDDIKLYLECNFRILMDRPTNRLTFPEARQLEATIDDLVRRSSGQFIYPSAVLKFIKDPTESPNSRLGIALGISPPSAGDHPLAQLDALYMRVLSNTKTADHRVRARRVLGALIVLPNRSPEELGIFLSLKPESLRIALLHLQSVVHVPDADSSSQEIFFYHATFSEFLLNPLRSGEHFININEAYKDLTRCYLRRWDDEDQHFDTDWLPSIPFHTSWLFNTINERGLGEFLDDLDSVSNISSLMQSMDMEDEFTKQVQRTLIFTFVHQLDEYSKDTENARSIYEKYVTALDQYHILKLQNCQVQGHSLKVLLPHALACQGSLDLLEALGNVNLNIPAWDPELLPELLPGLNPDLSLASSGYYERFFSDPCGEWSIENKTYYNIALEHLEHAEDEKYTSLHNQDDFSKYILFILQKATYNLFMEGKIMPDSFHPARIDKLCAVVDEKCRDEVRTLLVKIEFHEECTRVSRAKVIEHGLSADTKKPTIVSRLLSCFCCEAFKD